VVIVGCGFIGMEVAAAVCKTAKSVTVIGREKVPFVRTFGEKIGTIIQKLHEAKGVKFKMEAIVDTLDEGLFHSRLSISY